MLEYRESIESIGEAGRSLQNWYVSRYVPPARLEQKLLSSIPEEIEYWVPKLLVKEFLGVAQSIWANRAMAPQQR